MSYTIKVNARPEASPLVDRKIMLDGPETMNLPFTVPPPSPASQEPVRVNSVR
jgi:hypothetical protein